MKRRTGLHPRSRRHFSLTRRIHTDTDGITTGRNRRVASSLECLVSLVCSALPAFAEEKKDEKVPNIIFIMADDLWLLRAGLHGQAKIKTPNIDKLAEGDGGGSHTSTPAARCSAVALHAHDRQAHGPARRFVTTRK